MKSNIIPNIHRFITNELGENYWFNGCARYAMESAGAFVREPDFGYWFFAGLTGDIFAQVFSYDMYMGECVSACRFHREGGGYLERVFARCGYASSYVEEAALLADRELYVKRLMDYIDNGMPVITLTRLGPPWGVYVGYEDEGDVLLFLTDNESVPARVPLAQAIDSRPPADEPSHASIGWLFVGPKEREIDLAQAYREAIIDIPRLFAVRNEAFCFGGEAFRAWAERIEGGYFERFAADGFDTWSYHTSNICNMATNGSCVHSFLRRAQQLNPDMTFLGQVGRHYRRTAEIWQKDNGHDLESLGAGFNVTLEALCDPQKRLKIGACLREAAQCMDAVAALIRENCP